MIEHQMVFVHIPKTAGSSFATYLKQVESDVVRDIEKFWYDEYTDPKDYDKHKIIYGHFTTRKYMYLNPTLITFLRNPVERVISQYFYNRKKECPDCDILEYAKIPKYRNIMTKQIVDLSYFDFIGLQDYFWGSLNLFAFKYGVKFEEGKIHKRNNRFYKEKIPRETQAKIKQLNWEDHLLYSEAKKRWMEEYENYRKSLEDEE